MLTIYNENTYVNRRVKYRKSCDVYCTDYNTDGNLYLNVVTIPICIVTNTIDIVTSTLILYSFLFVLYSLLNIY